LNAQAIANAQVPGRDQDRYKISISEADLTLGRLSAAKAICALIAKPDSRHQCFLRVAFSVGDRQLGRQHLDQLRAAPAQVVSPVDIGPCDMAQRNGFGEAVVRTGY
jgi:hypothetical protein